eukprot:m.258007 g.258007  ORF g.258007 m.258007 type:complete len:223 (+) comp21216_c0_seq1:12-680(+)
MQAITERPLAEIESALSAAKADHPNKSLAWFSRTLVKLSAGPLTSQLRLDVLDAVEQLPQHVLCDANKLQIRMWAFLAHKHSKLEYVRIANRLVAAADGDVVDEASLCRGVCAELELEGLAFTPGISPQAAIEGLMLLHRELADSEQHNQLATVAILRYGARAQAQVGFCTVCHECRYSMGKRHRAAQVPPRSSHARGVACRHARRPSRTRWPSSTRGGVRE